MFTRAGGGIKERRPLFQVLLCEVDSTYSNVPQSVAVRSAAAASAGGDREDFLRECRLLAGLSHANVARLVGVCTPAAAGSDDDDGDSSAPSYCSVLEHSPQGDLYHFLRQSPSPSATSSSSSSGVTYPKLLGFAAQIASGMRYLESRGVVHKDLAAR